MGIFVEDYKENKLFMVRCLTQDAVGTTGKSSGFYYAEATSELMAKEFILDGVEPELIQRMTEKFDRFRFGDVMYVKVPAEFRYLVWCKPAQNEILQVADIIDVLKDSKNSR